MRPLNILCLAAALCLHLIPSSQSLVVHEGRQEPLRAAIDRRRIEGEAMLPMRIGLRQNPNALAQAETWLMSVSGPDSSDFGQHWSHQEVVEAFKPANETLRAVEDWLTQHGILDWTRSDNGQWIALDLPAAKVEDMLHTAYFEHQLLNDRFEVSTDRYFLPEYLQAHIDFIKPGVKGSDITGRTKRSRVYLRNIQLKVKRCKHLSEPYPSSDLMFQQRGDWHSSNLNASLRDLFESPKTPTA